MTALLEAVDSAEAIRARKLIEQTVRRRATHETRDDVGDTRSYANMERTLKREYWGRFLIELLQNARDAWNIAHPDATDGVVLVRLTREPALIVANQGQALRPEVLLDSISKFGETTKEFGAAIGHKGIGFKAVLEISVTPEIYSRTSSGGPFDLRVSFDPEHARRLIHEMTPNWDALVRELASADSQADPDERVPILRFPTWVRDPGDWLVTASHSREHTFNTVMKLPFDSRYAPVLGLDKAAFVERVRAAIADLSDEIVLLLRSFGTVLIEDDLSGQSEIVRRVESPADEPETATTERYSTVTITRDEVETSRWLLADERLSSTGTLEEEVAVGVRLTPGDLLDGAVPSVALASSEPAGLPFHLYFPTRIPTHLPFLLHAYFQVDAGRKAFAEDEGPRNERLLDALRSLTVRVVRHLGYLHVADRLDLSPLPDLMAATAGDADEPVALAFRNRLLGELDHVRYVPALGDDGLATPSAILADPRGELGELLPAAFPHEYLSGRTGLRYASHTGPAGLAFLAERGRIARSADQPGLDADTLRRLLRPGDRSIWPVHMDAGFAALVQVLEHLRADDPVARDVVTGTVGDVAAIFIPVSHPDPPYRRLRGPAPAGAGVIMARSRVVEDDTLVPPLELGIDFLGEGALPRGLLSGVAVELGIREYSTDTVLDAVATRGHLAEPKGMLHFLWRLLLRERLSSYSVPAAIDAAQLLDPGRFFWATRGRGRTEVDRARRERALNGVRLPTRSGQWRPAADLCFGADWADWVESLLSAEVGAAAAHRAAAYRDMESIAPSPDSLLASPEVLAELLPVVAGDTFWAGTEAGPGLPLVPHTAHALLLHVFLLRLGVWEVPPVEAMSDFTDRAAGSRDEWSQRPERSAHLESVHRAGGSFAAYRHANTHVAEDASLLWPPGSTPEYVRALGRGAELYETLQRIGLFCRGCKTHTTRYFNNDHTTRQPSLLIYQLSSGAWVPVELAGRPSTAVHPDKAWIEPERPDASRIAQSPLRFLSLATMEVNERLAHLVGIQRLQDAGAGRLGTLLRELHDDFADLVPDAERAGTVAATAFAGLHRLVYERLAQMDSTKAAEVVADTGVLAIRGRRLDFVAPAQARHDDGRWATYKRHFLGRIPFSVLAREQTTTAAALGIRRFDLSIIRSDALTESSVTEEVRPLILERAPELLALQVFHPLGGPALELTGMAFVERAARLANIEIVQLDNLVVEIQVVGSEERERIGIERDHDVLVENATTARPVLYHDLSGPDWVDRLRGELGHHLAVVLENPAYGPLFQLLLQQEDGAQRESFLLERGVGEDELRQVQEHLSDRDSEAIERRWWRAVLPLVGAKTPMDGGDPLAAARLSLEEAGMLEAADSIGAALLKAGAGSGVRSDIEPSGILARLEREGVALHALDESLRATGDTGLRIDVATQRLIEWRRTYGREVSALLAAKGKSLDAAREAPRAWQPDASASHVVDVRATHYLADVLLDLRSVDLQPDAEALAGPGAREHLHSLLDEQGRTLGDLWHQLFGPVEGERLQRDRAAAWRRALRTLLTAARTQADEPSYRIRAEADEVDRALPANPARPEELGESVVMLLTDDPLLGSSIRQAIEQDDPIVVPTVDSLVRALRDVMPDPAHVDRVLALLTGRERKILDRVRRQVDIIQALNLRPVVAVTNGRRLSPPRPPGPGDRRRIIGPRRRHDQRVLDRLGADGESWALSSVIEQLIALSPGEYERAVRELQTKLASSFDGPIVDGLLRRGDEALADDVQDDDRVEALAAFLHVAQASDEFGFDMLGWLPAAPDGPAQALLLEVKNSKDRGFNVSPGEWRTAARERGDYAFLIVLRGSDRPLGMELLPDPVSLHEEGRLTLTEDGWVVAYRLGEAG